MRVIGAGQRLLTVGRGRFHAVRLLHFAAASPLQPLTLKRQSSWLAAPCSRQLPDLTAISGLCFMQ